MDESHAKHKIELLLAEADVQLNGSRAWDMQVHHDQLFRRILSSGSLGLGEAYMEGWWDAKALDLFFCKVFRAGLNKKIPRNLKEVLRIAQARLFNMQSRAKARGDITYHYDRGNDLYFSFLDPYYQYSCAYFDCTSDLNEAQEKKLDLICHKLDLNANDTVLDIGCGWGGFAHYAASRYGCHVTGITLSEEQQAFAKAYCKDLPVSIMKWDYRDVGGRYDKIVSVGMLEHVGHKNYRQYMKAVQQLLNSNGLFLLHTIGTSPTSRVMDPWMHTYIFPNALIPSVSQVVNSINGLFVIEDWHNFGVHYARTLRAWSDRLRRHWTRIKSRYDERFYRMWQYYLLSSAGTFDARVNHVWQIVLSPKGINGGYQAPRWTSNRLLATQANNLASLDFPPDKNPELMSHAGH